MIPTHIFMVDPFADVLSYAPVIPSSSHRDTLSRKDNKFLIQCKITNIAALAVQVLADRISGAVAQSV